jgi:hypothetical protein
MAARGAGAAGVNLKTVGDERGTIAAASMNFLGAATKH